jgi:hypothetical protein
MYSRPPGGGAVIIIADTGMLMGEVLQSSRPPEGSRAQGRITSLLWALHRQGAVLILPRHVLEEVERDLPRRAGPADDLELARRRLHALYLSQARIVDVPGDWGDGDSRVQAVAQRHPADLPTARLAVALGHCFLLAEDPDLCDTPGLGVSAWLKVTHATANGTEVDTIYVGLNIPVTATQELVGAASRRIAAASPAARWALAGVVILIAAGATWWIRSGRAGKLAEHVRPVIREMADTLGPQLAETLTRYQQGRVVLAPAAVPPADDRTLAERIARILAFHSTPVLAEDIARELGSPGNLRDRTKLVRAEFRACAAFAEVSRGRWMLGTASGYLPAALPLIEVAEFRERLHKDTRKPLTRPAA